MSASGRNAAVSYAVDRCAGKLPYGAAGGVDLRHPVCIAYSQLLLTVWAEMLLYPPEKETCATIIVGCNPVIRIANHNAIPAFRICRYIKRVQPFVLNS